MKIDINDIVAVKLTPSGRAKLNQMASSCCEVDYSAEDMWPTRPDGTTKFVLLELMSIFGPVICFGYELPFNNTIMIDDWNGVGSAW